MERPKGYGDFANLIRETWTDRELREMVDELERLERDPGFARLQALLATRERSLVDRLVLSKPDDVRSTDQVIGILAGLRQSGMALDALRYAIQEARERAAEAAAEADAEGATA